MVSGTIIDGITPEWSGMGEPVAGANATDGKSGGTSGNVNSDHDQQIIIDNMDLTNGFDGNGVAVSDLNGPCV